MTDTHLRHGHLEWTGGMSFSAGAPGGPAIIIDGDGAKGPGPMVTLLLAAGGCAGSDVVSILEKMQITLSSLRIEVTGVRNPDYPRRYRELTLVFTLSGEGLTEAKAERAVELSVTKYCSVLLSLNPDIPVQTKIVIN